MELKFCVQKLRDKNRIKKKRTLAITFIDLEKLYDKQARKVI